LKEEKGQNREEIPQGEKGRLGGKKGTFLTTNGKKEVEETLEKKRKRDISSKGKGEVKPVVVPQGPGYHSTILERGRNFSPSIRKGGASGTFDYEEKRGMYVTCSITTSGQVETQKTINQTYWNVKRR